MSRLIQIKASKKKLEKYDELVMMLGLGKAFGSYQQAIDFSIDLALFEVKRLAEVLPDLESKKLDLLLSSIKHIKKEHEKARLKAEIDKKSEMVLP